MRGDLLCNTKAFARDKTSRNFERDWEEVIRLLVSDGMSRCLRNTQNEDFFPEIKRGGEGDDLMVLIFF